MKKNRLYIGILACAALWTACSEEDLRGIHTEIAPGEVHFYGAIKKQSNIQATSRTTPNPDNYITLNETTENFGTFYIWQDITSQKEEGTTEELHYFQQYEEAQGEQGNLAVVDADNEEGRLNWHDQTSEHTFYSWTQPNVTDNDQKITGGVDMGNTLSTNWGKQESKPNITGTVTYGTNGETNLEKFIVTKKGPISYDEWGQDVALYFERPIAKITLLGVTYIDANGAENANIQTCTLLFPNMYKTASFNPFLWNDNGTQEVLSTDDNKNKKGIKWEWHKTTTNGYDAKSLYVHPFQFGKDGDSTQSDDNNDDNTGIHQDRGFFIIQMAFDGGSTKSYTGTLNSLNLTPTSTTAKKQLNAGEHMQLYLTVTDGGGVGIGYQIIDWDTEEEQTLPQYRIPGVYNKDDADRLLEALQKAADISTYPDYTFPEGVEDLVVERGTDPNKTYEINLFTHIDWSSVEDEITTINIPDNCILKGNGYNVTLGDGVNITGTGDYKENLYINNNAPGVYSQTDADKLLKALTATEESSEKFPNGVKDLLVGSTINLFWNIDWSSYAGTEAITIPDGYSLNGNDHNITLPDGVSITGNNIENLYVNGEPYSNENGESDTDEPSESDATGGPTT